MNRVIYGNLCVRYYDGFRYLILGFFDSPLECEQFINYDRHKYKTNISDYYINGIRQH